MRAIKLWEFLIVHLEYDYTRHDLSKLSDTNSRNVKYFIELGYIKKTVNGRYTLNRANDVVKKFEKFYWNYVDEIGMLNYNKNNQR